jgi:biopolymer transport protein ExbD
MKFTVRKHRSPPAVIIISLIDVLIVVLIFLMVTTTFKQQNAVKLVLPESKQAKPGANENALVVTISKQGILSLGKEENAVTPDKLQERLIEEIRKNPAATLSIRADTDAPFGRIFKVMDAAKAANIKVVSAFTKNGAGQ